MQFAIQKIPALLIVVLAGALCRAEELPTPPRIVPLKPTPTFISVHTKRVKKSLLMFRPVLTGDDLPIEQRRQDIKSVPDAPTAIFGGIAAPTIDPLDHLRLRDRLLLFRPPQDEGRNVAFGIAMFGASTIMAAHLPEPLRLIFQSRVHFGPAILGDGGMGAGVGGLMK